MTNTRCGKIPPSPPGVNIDNHIRMSATQINPWWFRDKVQGKGPWDYKQQGRLYEDFGNFHYGATAKAFGFPENVIYREAGRVQQAYGTSKSNWGTPGSRFNPFEGVPPYGDDPDDQAQIKKGIDYCTCMRGR